MGLAAALVAAAAVCSPDSSRSSSPVFPEVLPATVAKPDPGRPAKKQKVDRRRREHRPEREAMPSEYVKGPGSVGKLHPHWRKSFPDDEEDATGRGKVVDVPDALRLYGEWRRVPGFWKILASDEGFIMTEGDLRVRTPSVGSGHYLSVNCNGTPERVHNLVCRAFKGRPTPEQVSADHKGGKTLSMAERRQDNRAVNLEWATYAQQNANQGDAKAHSDGEPCLVWQVVGRAGGNQQSAAYMTPTIGAARRFPSLLAATTALGLDTGHLSAVLNGKRKTVVGTDAKRYTGKWDSDHTKLPGEKWKVYWRSEKKKKAGALRISNHGRIQWGYPGRWGHMHYPESSDADGYLKVNIDGQNKYVHILVGELFFIGPKPRNWAVWDHKDLDKQNNHINNLRPVTVETNGVNTARQRDFYIWPKDDPDDWERCVSQRAAARTYSLNRGSLGDLLRKRRQANGSVPKTTGGYCAAWCYEVD